MNMCEYIALLENQLELLKEAQQEALGAGLYGDVCDMSKQIKMIGLWLLQAAMKQP